MKTFALCMAVALAAVACSTSKTGTTTGANAPVLAAEVAPPKCGPAPKLPSAVATQPGFTRATTVVGFMLAPTGEVSAVRLVKPSGYAQLDNAVVAQVRLWRCPGTSRRTLAMPVELPFEFKPEPAEQSDIGRR